MQKVSVLGAGNREKRKRREKQEAKNDGKEEQEVEGGGAKGKTESRVKRNREWGNKQGLQKGT